MNCIDRGLTLPALAGQFTGDRGAAFGDGAGKGLSQIKITADASLVRAIKTEHGLGGIEIRQEFYLAIAGGPPGVVVTEIDGQGPQLREFEGEAGRPLYALALLFSVFEAGTCS